MRDNFVFLPKNDVAQADGACPAQARNFEVFATAHRKEKPQKIILLEGHHERTGRHPGAHAEDLID